MLYSQAQTPFLHLPTFGGEGNRTKRAAQRETEKRGIAAAQDVVVGFLTSFALHPSLVGTSFNRNA